MRAATPASSAGCRESPPARLSTARAVKPPPTGTRLERSYLNRCNSRSYRSAHSVTQCVIIVRMTENNLRRWTAVRRRWMGAPSMVPLEPSTVSVLLHVLQLSELLAITRTPPVAPCWAVEAQPDLCLRQHFQSTVALSVREAQQQVSGSATVRARAARIAWPA